MKNKEYIGVKKRYDKSHLTWVDGQGWEGVVYKYTLVKPGHPQDGWSYIGETPEESTRRSKWNKPNSNYAGEKITTARETFGIKMFSYSVLERIYDEDIDRLREKLEEREAYYIEQYDSIENGFNASAGGTGRKGQKIDQDEIDRRNAARGDFHHTDEAKQKISDALINHEVTLDTRNKISKGNTGKKRTPEQNKAQSDRMKGIEPTAASEGAKKWREENGGGYWKGKEIPPEARANMKAAQQERGTSVRVIFPDGHTKDFPTMLDASKQTGDGTGSVKYSIEHGNITKRGYRYEKIEG